MHPRHVPNFLLAAVLGLLAMANTALAETATTPPLLIEDLRARVTADASIDAAGKTLATELLDAAAVDQRSTTDLIARTEQLRSEALAAPAEIERLQQSETIDRSDDLAAWARSLPKNADADLLEQWLAREGEEASQAYANMERFSTALAESQAKSVQNVETLARLRDELGTLDSLTTSAGETTALSEVRAAANAARRQRIEAEIQYGQTEQDTAAIRQSLLEVRIREIRIRLLRWLPRLVILKDRLADLSRAELKQQSEALSVRQASLQAVGGAAADMATANATLGADLVDQNDRLVSERDELLQVSQDQAQASQSLRDTRIRLELGGDSDTVGMLLRSERGRMQLPSRLSRRLNEVGRELTAARLRLATTTEAQRESNGQDSVLAAVRADRAITNDDDEAAVADDGALDQTLRERIDLLDQMENLLRKRIATLEQIELTTTSLLDDTRNLTQILDERLLWIPSHAPIDTTWLKQLPAGAHDLLKPSRFVTTAELLHRSWQQRPFVFIGSLVLVLALFLLRAGMKPRIEALAQPVRSVRTDRYAYSIRALGFTLLAALPWAAAVFLLGWLLQGVGESGKYSDSLGRALMSVSAVVFTLDVLRWLSIERGLAHAHFRWTRARRQTLQTWLPRLAVVALPLLFLIMLAFIRNQDLAINMQARIAIVLLCLFLAWAMWRMLAAGALWTPRGTQPEPSSARKWLRVLAVAALVATAGLALAGYVYTAGMFAESHAQTAGMLTLLAITHGMISRWFLLGERRLTLRRAEQKRAAKLAEAAESDSEDAPSESIEEEAIQIETISAQTQRLLRAFTLTLLVFGLLWTWSSILPALAYLDEISLWQYGNPSDPSGSGTVTLFRLFAGLMVLSLTIVATRNLPGLIELGLLSRTRIDAASRYAITSVARYAIIVIGMIAGLGLLGLHWSQLQWLAAALTVGLGFGLQEIFANFVSGLILLFEKPFRIGDQITIGEFTGTVTRIRTRATTLRDGDGREIFVPNKSFITGQLINWTLSDTVTQVGLNVQVAAGSDVKQVHSLLKQAAAGNARVIEDPAPATAFQGVTGSALDFELRVAVGTLGDRGAVRNELYASITELFAANGIAFASPQMDLHVRDLPAQWKPPE